MEIYKLVSMLTLNTSRLVLQDMTDNQASVVGDFYRDERYRRFLHFKNLEETKSDLRGWAQLNEAKESRRLSWLMSLIDKDTSTIIGMIHLIRQGQWHDAELMYGLHPDYWGQGLATEAVQKMTRFAHDTKGIMTIDASVMTGNVASCRILEKAGFVAGEICDDKFKKDANPSTGSRLYHSRSEAALKAA